MSGRVLGAVLAGGASSRFGSDKAVALLEGRTLLEHARAAIAPFVDAVVVVGRGEVDDLPAPGLGPLGGIAGALDHARHGGFGSVLTIGCDMPVVPAGLIEALLAKLPSCCADAPVLGHWPAAISDELLARLSQATPSPHPRAGSQGPALPLLGLRAEPGMPRQARHGGGERHERDGTLSVRRWATEAGAIPIPAPSPLRNVNTPADLSPS